MRLNCIFLYVQLCSCLTNTTDIQQSLDILALTCMVINLCKHFNLSLLTKNICWNENAFLWWTLIAPLWLYPFIYLFIFLSIEKEAKEYWRTGGGAGASRSWLQYSGKQAASWHSSVPLLAAASPPCVRKGAVMFNWISSASDGRVDGAARAFDITRWQFSPSGNNWRWNPILHTASTFRPGNRGVRGSSFVRHEGLGERGVSS